MGRGIKLRCTAALPATTPNEVVLLRNQKEKRRA